VYRARNTLFRAQREQSVIPLPWVLTIEVYRL